jgi:hypothetical protein
MVNGSRRGTKEPNEMPCHAMAARKRSDRVCVPIVRECEARRQKVRSTSCVYRPLYIVHRIGYCPLSSRPCIYHSSRPFGSLLSQHSWFILFPMDGTSIDHRPSTIDHRPSTIDHRVTVRECEARAACVAYPSCSIG